MSAAENGGQHEHVWRLHREDSGKVYDTQGSDEVYDFDELPYREVTIRVFYCEVCRVVNIDREYGEDTFYPIPPRRPARSTRPWWLRLPVSWRPW